MVIKCVCVCSKLLQNLAYTEGGRNVESCVKQVGERIGKGMKGWVGEGRGVARIFKLGGLSCVAKLQ